MQCYWNHVHGGLVEAATAAGYKQTRPQLQVLLEMKKAGCNQIFPGMMADKSWLRAV
jgi:hypothetical protein